MPNAVHHLPSLSFNSDAVATLRNRYIEKIIMDHHSCSFQCWALRVGGRRDMKKKRDVASPRLCASEIDRQGLISRSG